MAMKETTPEVELIARPSIDYAALERYLKAVGGEGWLQMRTEHEDSPNPGQLLIESAAQAAGGKSSRGAGLSVRLAPGSQAQVLKTKKLRVRVVSRRTTAPPGVVPPVISFE